MLPQCLGHWCLLNSPPKNHHNTFLHGEMPETMTETFLECVRRLNTFYCNFAKSRQQRETDSEERGASNVQMQRIHRPPHRSKGSDYLLVCWCSLLDRKDKYSKKKRESSFGVKVKTKDWVQIINTSLHVMGNKSQQRRWLISRIGI